MSLLQVDYVMRWVPQAAANPGLVSEAIVEAEALAARYCDRDSFESASYTEYHSPDRAQRLIYLRNYPITGITSVKEGAQDTSPSTLATTDYNRRDAEGILERDGGSWDAGFETVEVVYTAGYTDANLPADLRIALRQLVAFAIGFRGNVGNQSAAIDGLSETKEPLVRGVPQSIAMQLNSYRRLLT